MGVLNFSGVTKFVTKIDDVANNIIRLSKLKQIVNETTGPAPKLL